MVASDAQRTAFVFPGQGSQAVGMGRAWAVAYEESAAVFATADEALGFPLSELCWQGPAEELQLTANTQPAILAASIAVHRAALRRGLAAGAVAGHSLGEYSAHVAAGTLELAEALRLVRRRGELMQRAVPVGEGAMAAVLGADDATVAALAAEAAGEEVCSVANYNAPGQAVIAGHRGAVERAVALARDRGARRAMLLPVSAPFHCALMGPAREALEPELRAAAFAHPSLPVVVNVDAAPVETGEAAREALVRQVDGPVRWVASVRRMVDELGINRFVEIGPGAVLTGLIRRIEPSVEAVSVAEPADLDALLEEGGGGG